MGSEMCIRDRAYTVALGVVTNATIIAGVVSRYALQHQRLISDDYPSLDGTLKWFILRGKENVNIVAPSKLLR